MNRNLNVDPRLLEQLQLLRAQLHLTKPAVLEERDVVAVETAFGVTLPDGILALFAALRLDLRSILTLTDSLADEGLPARALALFEDPDGIIWCYRPGETKLRTFPAGEVTSMPPAAVVRRWRHLVTESLERDPLPIKPLTPSIRERRVAARMVSHPRFGVGQVVRELPGPRPALEVDFAEVGRKRLLASYVTELDRVA